VFEFEKYPTSQSATAALLQVIPLGTDAAKAKQVLKEAGADCRPMTGSNAELLWKQHGRGGTPPPGTEHLICDYMRVTGLLTAHLWRTYLRAEDGQVPHLQTNVGGK
jgi:hypothetical protein